MYLNIQNWKECSNFKLNFQSGKEKDSSIGWGDYLYEVGQALMQGATGERRMHGYATLNDMKRRKLREKEKHWCEGFRKEKKRLKQV